MSEPGKNPNNGRDSPVWSGGEDLSRWEKKKFTPREKLTARVIRDCIPVAETEKKALSSLSPLLLALAGVCSLGITSIAWIRGSLLLINNDVRPEERPRMGCLSVWTFLHALFLVALCLAAREFVVDCGMDWRCALAKPYIPLAALFCFSLSFVMSRYYLFWIKNALAEEAEKRMDEWLSASGGGLRSAAIYRFVRSPIMLWFAGVSYMQFHIHRMVKYGAITKFGFNPSEEPVPEADAVAEETDKDPVDEEKAPGLD